MMSTNETTSRVTDFFESYRLAFERLDASAIAEHFAYPSHITSDTGEILLMPVVAKLDWTHQIERLLDMYRAIGFASAHILHLVPAEVSPRLVQVVVDWALQDNAGSLLYNFRATYTLAEIGNALRISGIAHNEIPQYREYLARLQSQRIQSSDSQAESDGS